MKVLRNVVALKNGFLKNKARLFINQAGPSYWYLIRPGKQTEGKTLSSL